MNLLEELNERYEKLAAEARDLDERRKVLMLGMNEMLPAIWALQAETEKATRSFGDGEAMRKADADASREPDTKLPPRHCDGCLVEEGDLHEPDCPVLAEIKANVSEAPAEPQTETDTQPPSISDDGKGAEGEALPEGFTPHASGPCPFEKGARLVVMTRKCGEWPITVMDEAPLLWEHEGHDLDVIGYRLDDQEPRVETSGYAHVVDDGADSNSEPGGGANVFQQQADMALQEESEDAETHTDDERTKVDSEPLNANEQTNKIDEHPDAGFWGKALAKESEEREQARGLISKLFGGEKKPTLEEV